MMKFDFTNLIDLHIHTQPDVWPRLMDDILATTAARSANMRAIFLKSHVAPTAGRAP
jgi:hypothetical protein